MIKPLHAFLVLTIISISCHRKATKSAEPATNEQTIVVTSEVDQEDEQLMKKGPEKPEQVIVLVCQFLAPMENEQIDSRFEDCANKPCRARVKILSVVEDNSSFKGAFNQGDNVALGFDHGFELNEGDYFTAEVYGSSSNYRVKQYEKR